MKRSRRNDRCGARNVQLSLNGVESLERREYMAADLFASTVGAPISPVPVFDFSPVQVESPGASVVVEESGNSIGSALETPTAENDNGVLRITGSDQNDAARVEEVDGLIRVSLTQTDAAGNVLHDRVQFFRGNEISSIVFKGYDGDDRFINRTNLFSDASGGDGRDTLQGGSNRDLLRGDGDHDVILGGEGDDELQGGEGHDRMLGQGGADVMNGGRGKDRMYGGEGRDTIDGGFGNDRILGGAGDDDLSGNTGNDRIYGDQGGFHTSGGGNDEISGGDGRDFIVGQSGNDHIDGGRDQDRIYGGFGDDRLEGGEDDALDFLFGEEGADTFIFYKSSGFLWWADPGEVDRAVDVNSSEGDTVKGI